MINRTSRYIVLSAMLAVVAQAQAGTTIVTPALAACSKALVESLASSRAFLPTYSVKAPTGFAPGVTDPNSFTVLAHSTKTKALLAKASCKATSAGQIVSFKSIPVKS